MESTPAILLRKIKLTETSLIVSWLSAEHGLLKTVAKGARAPKSQFAGLLDLFFDCEIGFTRSQRSELHGLREVSLKEPFAGLRQDYNRVATASYFVELIELVTEPDHPVPELYDLLQRALGHLNTNPASSRALRHFERELCRLLGIQDPETDPGAALNHVYHRLPRERATLLQRLTSP